MEIYAVAKIRLSFLVQGSECILYKDMTVY